MIRVYIAGPFTGDVEANCAAAIDAGERVRQAGHLPFIPHLYRAWHERHPASYEEAMALCFAEVSRCDVLLRMPGASPGADREVKHAIERGIPVVYNVESITSVAVSAPLCWGCQP